MSLTEEEKNEILDLAVERTLLKIPEVVGNLITHHMSQNKMNKDFYEKHPKFRDHKELVASVIEQVEGNNSPMDYTKLLEKAIPEIEKRIDVTKDLDLVNVDVPKIDYNGEL